MNMKIKLSTFILLMICGLFFGTVCRAQGIQAENQGSSLAGAQNDESNNCQDGSCNLGEHDDKK